MKRAVKGFVLGASILAVGASGVIATSLNLANSNNFSVASNFSEEETTTILAEDFLADISAYDWTVSNTYELESDVDFTNFDYSSYSGDVASIDTDEAKFFEGNGHKFFIEDSETNISWGNGWNNEDLSEGFVFDTISNITFNNLVLDGVAFFARNADNVSFNNFIFENILISNNLMSSADVSNGFLINEGSDLDMNNFIVQNISIENNEFHAIGNWPNTTDSVNYSTALFGDVSGVSADSIFVDGFEYNNNTFSREEANEFEFDFDANVLFGTIPSSEDVDLNNMYFSNVNVINSELVSPNVNININLVASADDSNGDGEWWLDDAVVDNSIINDYGDINFFADDEFYTTSTYVVKDNSKALDTFDRVQVVSEESMYSTGLFTSILGDVKFITQDIEAGAKPEAITDFSVLPQVDYIAQKVKFANVSQVIAYSFKSFFVDLDDRDTYEYSIGVKQGDKILVEEYLSDSGRVEGKYSRLGDKDLFIRNDSTGEYVFLYQVWETSSLFIVWIVLIILLILLIIVVLAFILRSIKKDMDKKAGKEKTKEPKKAKENKDKDSKPKKEKKQKQPKPAKAGDKKAPKNSKPKKQKPVAAGANSNANSKVPKEDEYFYFHENNDIPKQEDKVINAKVEKEDDFLSAEDLENIEKLLDN